MLSQVFNICKKKIFRWYKEVLSGFNTPQIQEELHLFDTIDSSIIDPHTKKPLRVYVPLCKEENFGKNMCIDEKNIGKQIYTIISNKDTGKPAVIASTTKTKILEKILSHVSPHILFGVETLSKDLAPGYEELKKRCFMKATSIADKFHVIQMGLKTLSDMRSIYRQRELTRLRELREIHKETEAERREFCTRNRTPFTPRKTPSLPKQKNGETSLEILSRSNRALMQFSSKWGKEMKERVDILFLIFPNLKKAYRIICAFRGIYNKATFEKGVYEAAKKSFNKWYQSVGALNIPELQNFASSVKHHQNQILAYFLEGHTNAFAESLNAKIQRFVTNNYGIRNRNFFHYRLCKIFS